MDATILKENFKLFIEALSEELNYVLSFMESILKILCDINCIYSILKKCASLYYWHSLNILENP